MKTNKLLGIMLLLAFFVGCHTSAQASSGYLNTFNTRYGTSGTALNSCIVCHTTASASPSTRNSYGAAFGSHAHSYPQIEALDSDTDTFTNLQEIQARTFPGNTSSHPAITLTSIAIQGASSVNASAASTYTTTAAYSNGTSKAVTATWSLTSPYATISAAGVLTAGAVTANQSVTVNASYTEGGVTRTATMSVTIIAPTPGVTLTGIAIQGASSVNASATSTYTALASYSDGTSKAVSATWSLTSPYATINASGVLSAQAVTGNQTVTINASYSEGAATKSAAKDVTIVDTTPAPPALTGLSVQGASTMNESTTSAYTATASFSDGSSKGVTASWSATSPYATISAGGVLSAKAISGNQTATITASYAEGAVTKAATKGVTIVDKTPAQGHLLFHDDFSNATPTGSPNWEVVLGTWSGKGRRYSATIGSNNIALVTNVAALDSFEAGQIESRIMLTNRPGGAKPNASIVFGYVDNTHYRYVRILEHRVVIGQVGNYEGETAGVKASRKAAISLQRWHTVRVDVNSTGLVSVYIDGQEAGDRDNHEDVNSTVVDTSPLVSYLFSGSATGQVGYAAKKARIFFDDFYAWDETVLP